MTEKTLNQSPSSEDTGSSSADKTLNDLLKEKGHNEYQYAGREPVILEAEDVMEWLTQHLSRIEDEHKECGGLHWANPTTGKIVDRNDPDGTEMPCRYVIPVQLSRRLLGNHEDEEGGAE